VEAMIAQRNSDGSAVAKTISKAPLAITGATAINSEEEPAKAETRALDLANRLR